MAGANKLEFRATVMKCVDDVLVASERRDEALIAAALDHADYLQYTTAMQWGGVTEIQEPVARARALLEAIRYVRGQLESALAESDVRRLQVALSRARDLKCVPL